MMFGNSNVPTSLVVYFDSALANYSVSSVSDKAELIAACYQMKYYCDIKVYVLCDAGNQPL